jgi:radical SAM enzyme (TIGR01210 family)
MNDHSEFRITDRWILNRRGKKNNVDPHLPYAWLVEKELSATGEIEDTGVVFLTNRECPFHCLMCDLWKNTTDESVPPGAISEQIEWALERMPGIKQIKLYNSGSFFDPRAIREDEYRRIASLLDGMKRVIVESHPAFIGERCLTFSSMLKPDLEVAIGLEVADDAFLKKLNKKMTPDDFRRSVHFLSLHGIKTRAFILLKPPFLTESEGIYQAERSVDFAFSAGAGSCVIIPVRAGNGAMDLLASGKLFSPPDIRSLEQVTEYAICLKRGRVFADTWDLGLFSSCGLCLEKRVSRLTEMNLYQSIPGAVECTCDI